MSQTIDQKVVEMKFDNKDFESNVKQSMSTLEKLKEDLKLEDSAESFKKIGNAAKEVSLDGLKKGIDEVNNHFGVLETVGRRVLKNITDDAYKAGKEFASSLSIDLVRSGFDQYASKTSAVQTIMAATGKSIDEVNTSLEELIWFADETSYSFEDMTNNVGKFTSVGVDLDTASKAMMGISDWAAVSGQNPQTASRAMYNLSQAMGLGYVGLMDWKSIELANMATKEFKENVIATAEAMGKINPGEVTAQNFRESLKDKWFDNDVLLEVLGKYSDYMDLVYQRVQETGESCADAMKWVSENMAGSYDLIGEKAAKAAQEAKTFQEAVEATRDAVKTIWAELFEDIFGNYEEAKETFTNFANTLWEVFAAPLSEFEETVAEAMEPKTIGTTKWNSLRKNTREELDLTAKEWTQFEEVIKQVAKDSGVDIDEIMKKHTSFANSLEEGWLNTDIFQDALDLIKNGTTETVDNLSEVQELVHSIWEGEYGVGEERRKRLEELGYSYEEIQALVDKGYEYEITLEDLEGVTQGFLTTTTDGLDSLRQKLENSDSVEKFKELASYMSGAELRNGIWDNLINSDTGAVVTYVGAIRDAFHDIFGTLDSGTIHDALVDIYTWTTKLLDEDRVQRFKTVVENIFHAIHAGIEILKGAFSVVKAVFDNTLGPLLKGLWEIVKAVASGIGELFKKADDGVSSLTIFSDAVEWLNKNLEPVKKAIEGVCHGIAVFIESLFKGKSVLESFKNGVKAAIDVIFGENSLSGEKLKNKFDSIVEKFVSLKDSILDTFKNIGEKISEFWTTFMGTELGQKISSAFNTVRDAITNAWHSVVDWVKGLFSSDEETEGTGFDFFGSIQNAIQTFNDWLNSLDIEAICTAISDAVIAAYNWVKDFVEGIGDVATALWDDIVAIGETIQEAWEAFKDTDLYKAITGLADSIKEAFENLWNSFTESSFGRKIIEIVTTIKTALTNAWNQITSWAKDLFSSDDSEVDYGFFDSIVGTLESFGETIRNLDIVTVMNDISDFVLGFKTHVTNAFKSVKEWFENNETIQSIVSFVKEKFQSLWETIKGAFNGGGDEENGEEKEPFFVRVANTVKAALEWFGENLPSIIETIKGLLGAGALGGLFALIMKIKNMFSSPAGIVASITKIFDGIAKAVRAYAFDKMATAILKIAAAILLLSIALTALSLVNPDNLMAAGAALSVTAIGLGAFAAGVSKLMEALGLKKEKEASARFSDAKSNLIQSLSNIGNSISGLIKTVGEAWAKSTVLKSYAALLVSLAIAMAVLGAAVYVFSGMSWEELGRGLAGALALVGMLAGAVKLMNVGTKMDLSVGIGGFSLNKIGNSASSLGLIGVAAAVLILVQAVTQICQYPLEQILVGLGTVGLIMLELVGFTRFAGNLKFSTGATLIALAVTIGIFIAEIGILSWFPAGDILVGIVALGLIMAEVVVFTRYEKALPKGGIKTILGIGVSMILFSISLEKLADEPWQGILVGVLALGAVMAEVAGFSYLMSKIDFKDSQAVMLIGMAAAVAAFGFALSLLADVPWQTLLAGMGAIVGIMAGVVGMAALLGKVNGDLQGIGIFLIGAAALIAAIAAAIYLVSKALDDVDMDQLKHNLSDLVTSLLQDLINTIIGSADTIIQGILDTIQMIIDNADRIVNMAVDLVVKVLNALTTRMPELANAIADFCGALIESFAEAFKDVDMTPIINALNEILFATMSLVIIGKFGSFKSVTKGIGMLAEVIGAFGLIIAAFGALNLIDGFKEFMAGGVDVLITVAEGIGGFFGALIGSFVGQAVESFSDSLPALGENLSDFMTKIGPFIEGAGSIDSSFVDSIGYLTEALLIITGGSFVKGISDVILGLFGGNDVKSYMELFGDLGEGVAAFSDAVSGRLDDASVETASKVAAMIMALTAVVPTTGGIFEWIVGHKDFANVKDDFSGLGQGVAAFCSAVSGMSASEATVNKAGTAAEAIAKLTAVVPNEGGLFQWIVGAPDMANAGTDFQHLGEGVAAFCESVSGMTASQETIDKAGTAAEAVAKLIAVVPKEGGLFQWIVGAPDMENAGTDFQHLGEGVAAFCGAIEGMTVSEETITKAGMAAEAIAKLTEVTPNQNGLFQWITGAPDLANSDVNFAHLGAGVAAFCESISGMTVSEDAVAKAIQASEAIGALTSVMPLQNGLFEWIVGAPDFSTVQDDFQNLGLGVVAFCTAVNDITTGEETINKAATAAEAVARLTETTPTEGGLFDWIVGKADFESSAEKYTYLGEGVVAFCNAVQGITTDTETIEKASVAAQAIAALQEVIPKEDGLIQFIVGQQNLENAGDNYGKLGKGVYEFCNAVSDIKADESTVSTAKTAAEAIAALQEVIPNEDGLIQFIVGQQDLDNAGDNYESLGTGVAAFCDAVSGITADQTTVETASTAAEAIGAIQSVLPNENGLFQWIVGAPDLDKAGDRFTYLGKGVAAFCTEIQDISLTEDTANAAKAAAEVVGALANATPSTGGLWQEIAGEKDLGKFGDNLGTLGAGVAAYVEATKNTTRPMITRGKIAAEGMLEIIGLQWPTSGGILNWITNAFEGDVDFDDLQGDFEKIGEMCQTLASSFTDDLDTGTINNAKTAAQSVVDILKMEWPTTDEGILGFLANLFAGGNTNFEVLKTQLGNIADMIVEFQSKFTESDLSTDNISNVYEILKSMIGLFDLIPDPIPSADEIRTAILTFVGVAKWVSENPLDSESINLVITDVGNLLDLLVTISETDLTNATAFSDTLKALGEDGISKFIEAFTNSKETTIDTVTSYINAVIEAIDVSDSFKTPGENDSSGFNDGLKLYHDTIVMTAKILITDTLTELTKDSDFKDKGSNDASAFNEGLKTFSSIIPTTASTIARDAITEMDQHWGFWTAGSTDMSSFIDGMESMSGYVADSAYWIGENAAGSIDVYWDFWNVGTNAMNGLIDGMNAMAQHVYDAAYARGQDAVNAANRALDSNSPSREMMKVGQYFDEGFAIGIEQYAYMSDEAASEMATRSTSIISDILGALNFDDLDNAPTIRPVLDLTNVQNGAAKIEDMLGAENLMGLDAIQAQLMANRIYQSEIGAQINNTYDDVNVINAINDLGGRVDSLGEAINNMKLYLNGKELVGGIAVDMNYALGNIDRKAKKGVM